jgi:spermidine/putrescine transport system ATP-binding protein
VLQIGTPAQIYESPSDAFVARFIGETNLFTAKVIERRGDNAVVDVPRLGQVLVEKDKEFGVGDAITFAIRPEKVRITRQKPADLSSDFNLFEGVVNERIYSGFHSTFFVRSDTGVEFHIVKQHVNYFEEHTEINWRDHVYLWWRAADGYMVKVEKSR